MNYVDYRFSLDVQEIGSQVFLTVKQGDTNRRLIINLTEGHEPYTIVEGCTAVLAGTKADGNVIFNNAVVEGNNIIYDFTEQTVAAVGSMKCEMRLYMEGRKLCSPNFTISVLPDAVSDAQIESLTEVNTLTELINEATGLIEDVNSDLERGAFVPELKIGIVETLPTGANATASITGSGKNLVLNLGLPRGPIGTAEGLKVDAILSKDSTNPIQNRPVAEEFEAVRAEQQEYAQDVAEAFAIVGENLENKVEKAAGKGLSTNDFTTAEKEKLAGIESGANKFALADGAVTRAKLAQDALYSPVREITTANYALSAANIGETLRVSGSTELTSADITFTLSLTDSQAIPKGTEIAILWLFGKSIKVVTSGGVRTAIMGGAGVMKNASFNIAEKYAMIALKKISHDATNGDIWTIQGNVEVVV